MSAHGLWINTTEWMNEWMIEITLGQKNFFIFEVPTMNLKKCSIIFI